MATFQTHFTTATVISSMLATGLLVTHLTTPKVAFFYTLLGTLGGLLPDLDAPKSIPARLFFSLSGILVATLVTVSIQERFTTLELLTLGILIYFGAYYSLYQWITKLTVHRGNFHSILAAFCFGLAITAGSYHFIKVPEWEAWIGGGFVTTGYLVHLLLDEMYSVDLKGRKLKKSFGSAFKIMSLRYKMSSLLLMLATVWFFLLTPNIDHHQRGSYTSKVFTFILTLYKL